MSLHNRRTFFRHASGLFLATGFASAAHAANESAPVAETAYGKVRGAGVNGINVFKGIPYGASTAGANRFMPPVKPAAWTGVRDALAWGPTAPQTVGAASPRAGAPAEAEDCLVLNVFTPSLESSAKKPVMVWLHGGGFSTGSGSGATTDGTNLARAYDVVVVSLNHRLNVLGFTTLGDEAPAAGVVGLLDIVSALEWVRDNIARFGGDPNLVTIFGQSGGGRKVSTLMSMPTAQGLFHRAIVESGAILKLTPRAAATELADLTLAELGLKRGQLRELQAVPLARLLAANAAALAKTDQTIPGYTANSPTPDGKFVPADPWNPAAPAISAKIPLMIGWVHTEETLYDRPTAEKLALDEAGLLARTTKRLGPNPKVAPERVIATYRKAHPEVSPWDLYILIATDHPRGLYARELARRKVAQNAAPAYVYRFDFETPEGGGHMRSPHAVEVPFVFHNIDVAGPLISKMPEAHALSAKISAAWAAFARTGNPNTKDLPAWPAYTQAKRDTMIFNTTSRIEQDPDSEPRKVMEQVLNVS